MGPDVTCWGTFLIKTPPKFQDLIMKGIGRHRAYGYGMIMLKHPHPPRVPRELHQARSTGTLGTQTF